MADNYDVVVIGGGAAGLMCAIEAGRRGRRVLVLEHADKVGKKILISGGGRCNFTNLGAVPDLYISENPQFAISALSRYTSADFIGLVEQHGIAYHEKTLGQLFCNGSSTQILDMLLQECSDANVEIRTSCTMTGVKREDAGFRVSTSSDSVSAESLVVATGGLSIPKMGATGLAYSLARQFGMAMTEVKPGLVPFTFRPPTLDLFNNLSGVSLGTAVTCDGVTWQESMLFTHRGLSGPAILQVSSYWRRGSEVTIDLLPHVEDAQAHFDDERARRPGTELATVVGRLMPKRVAQAMCGTLATRPLRTLSNTELANFAQSLKCWVVTPDGTEGYRTAEVTVGGVSTDGLSSRTMETKNVPGLYFIGEAVDVTGPLGGYNFQWAWASGYCAGQIA
ncbi:MAG: NAD(P)/FAD-dependent oxidoreductase [SAR202 cluster bacterium]|nr:NAD(P)/FAD-dependent oxidoreductase [SAR202 cluster bacterium]|tara:strand:- start:533 stop:1714 length:1182 start_codon:yes stop_codon:yes gene_type:complete